MTELEIMKRAKMYLDSLAMGVDPLTGQPVREGDIVRNQRISKCLTYVSGVLESVIEEGAERERTVRLRSADKEYFSLTEEQIDSLQPTVQPLSVSKLAAYINELIDSGRMRKLTRTAVVAWLVDAGFLSEETTDAGRKITKPTDAGREIGIYESELEDETGRVIRYVTYNKSAQQFVFDNITAIAEVCRQEADLKEKLKRSKYENRGKPWTQDETESLRVMYECGMSLNDISAELRRTRAGIRERLIFMGLMSRGQ